jgi:hypothetical protein
MKRSIQNMLIGIGATALAISIAVFNATTNASSLFLGIVSGILALVAITFFILHSIEKNKEYLKERESVEEANKAYFEDAEKIPVLSTEQMFRENFDAVNDDTKEDQKSWDFAVDVDYAEYINESIGLKDAVEDLKCFFAERGFKLNSGIAENLMSSLISSRFMIFTGVSSEEFNTVTSLLSEYFGSNAYAEAADPDAENGNDSANVYQNNNSVFHALQSAGALHERIHIVGVDGITEGNASGWVTPFVKYIKNPKKRNEISFFDASGKNVGYNIGCNFKMIFKLADGQRIDDLPVSVAKLATVVNIGFANCQTAEEQTSHLVFSSYQADYILSKECGKKDVSEEMWKKVDKLEKYTKQYSDYSIGNKLWLEFEKLVDILLTCGLEPVEALDAAISIRLLPSITAALKDKLTTEDRTVLQMMEFLFGENNVVFSKAFLSELNRVSKKADNTDNTDSADSEAESEDSEMITE